MLVYRIEDELFQGPFINTGATHHYDAARDYRKHGSCYGLLPGPRDEVWEGDFSWRDSNSRFAFRSIRQMLRFFTSQKGRRALAEVGFGLSVYEIPDKSWNYCYTPNQLAFNIKVAKLVEKRCLISLKRV